MKPMKRTPWPSVAIAVAVGVPVLGCSSSRNLDQSPDAQSPKSVGQLEEEAVFWAAFEIDGDWAEYFPTLRGMAEAADGVILGTVVSVEPTPPIETDAQEDLVREALLEVRVDDAIRSDITETEVVVSLVYAKFTPPEDLERSLRQLADVLPADPVLFLLRKRMDRQDQYRVVNGYGLWARTLRAELDTPLNPDPPSDGIYAGEVARASSPQALADALRP